jgi:hypothetical protein
MMLCISKASHKAAIVAALTVAAAAPANAFWPVIDVTSIAQQVQQVQQEIAQVPGGLAANQLQAKALAEVALQLEELRQAQNATQQQRTIDNQYIEHTLYGPSAFSASDI